METNPLEIVRAAMESRSAVEIIIGPIIPEFPLAGLPSAVEKLCAMPSIDEAELREHEWRTMIVPRLIAANVDQRFRREYELIPQQKRALDMCRDKLRGTGAVVALVGVRGCGKTTLASQLIIERAWRMTDDPIGSLARYYKLNGIIARFKPLYADFGSIDAEKLLASREMFCDVPLVIIDETHDCEEMKLRDRVLTDVIDRRYAKCRDTVLISNQTAQDFQISTNPSILSRLSEHGAIISCTWESFRQ